IDKLRAEKKNAEIARYETTAKWVEGALPLAKAIQAELLKKGILPVFECDTPTIIASRQAAGDIEYLFAVNGTPDAAAQVQKGNPEKNTRKARAATMALPAGKPVYDAVIGGPVTQFQAKGDKLVGQFRFGPGQMRVFARTARPIGGVRIATPVVTRELALETAPIRVDIAATLVDAQGGVLSGSAPLHIPMIDPL